MVTKNDKTETKTEIKTPNLDAKTLSPARIAIQKIREEMRPLYAALQKKVVELVERQKLGLTDANYVFEKVCDGHLYDWSMTPSSKMWNLISAYRNRVVNTLTSEKVKPETRKRVYAELGKAIALLQSVYDEFSIADNQGG